MAIRKIYKYTKRYVQVAQNEAADLLFSMNGLSKWIAEYDGNDTELINLFNEKLDKMSEMYDILEKIIRYGEAKGQ